MHLRNSKTEELWFLYLAMISVRAYKHMSVPSIDLQPNWLFIVLTNWWVVTAQWILKWW